MANELRIKNGIVIDNFTNAAIYTYGLSYNPQTGQVGYMSTASFVPDSTPTQPYITTAFVSTAADGARSAIGDINRPYPTIGEAISALGREGSYNDIIVFPGSYDERDLWRIRPPEGGYKIYYTIRCLGTVNIVFSTSPEKCAISMEQTNINDIVSLKIIGDDKNPLIWDSRADGTGLKLMAASFDIKEIFRISGSVELSIHNASIGTLYDTGSLFGYTSGSQDAINISIINATSNIKTRLTIDNCSFASNKSNISASMVYNPAISIKDSVFYSVGDGTSAYPNIKIGYDFGLWGQITNTSFQITGSTDPTAHILTINDGSGTAGQMRWVSNIFYSDTGNDIPMWRENGSPSGIVEIYGTCVNNKNSAFAGVNILTAGGRPMVDLVYTSQSNIIPPSYFMRY